MKELTQKDENNFLLSLQNDLIKIFFKNKKYVVNIGCNIFFYIYITCVYTLNLSTITENKYNKIIKNISKLNNLINEYINVIDENRMIIIDSINNKLFIKKYNSLIDENIEIFYKIFEKYKEYEKNFGYLNRKIIKIEVCNYENKIKKLKNIEQLLSNNIEKFSFNFTYEELFDKINVKFKSFLISLNTIVEIAEQEIENVIIKSKKEVIYIGLLLIFKQLKNKNTLVIQLCKLKDTIDIIDCKPDIILVLDYFRSLNDNEVDSFRITVKNTISFINKNKNMFDNDSFEKYIIITAESIYTMFDYIIQLLDDIMLIKLSIIVSEDDFYPSPPEPFISWRYYIEKY